MSAPKAQDLNLGNFLKIVSRNGVYNNLSEDSAIWDMVKKKKVSAGSGREIRQLLRSSYGAAAAGFVPASGGAYPDAAQSQNKESVTNLKDFALTVEVENTIIMKALEDFSRYGEPLAEEMRCKTIALSRQLSSAAFRDGSGVLGTVAGTPTIEDGRLKVVLQTSDSARGFIGWLEDGDKVIVSAANADLAAKAGQRDVDSSEGTTEHMIVYSKDRQNNTVLLEARTSAGAKVELVENDNVANNDVIRRYSNIFTSSITTGTTELNELSYDFIGLDALTRADGSKVNNIIQSGALKSTRYDAGDAAIDSQHFQRGMSQLMVAVGSGRYKYNKALQSWEAYDALIESREVDRRFQTVEDTKRGVKEMAYVHGKNTLLFTPDEFCPTNRIYVCPEGDVLQFHGSDFEYVQPNPGQKFHLKPNASGHDRVTRAYMEGQGALQSVHPAAILTIHNFKLTS